MDTQGTCDHLRKTYDACYAEWRSGVSLTDMLSLSPAATSGRGLHKCEALHADYRDCVQLYMATKLLEKKNEGVVKKP